MAKRKPRAAPPVIFELNYQGKTHKGIFQVDDGIISVWAIPMEPIPLPTTQLGGHKRHPRALAKTILSEWLQGQTPSEKS